MVVSSRSGREDLGSSPSPAATTKSAGKNLKPDRRKILEKAKQELRIIFKKN